MAEFTPSSKAHPCRVCSRTKDGDCREMSDGLVLCHSFRGDALQNGDRPPSGSADYRFIGDSEDGNWGRWKPEADWEERPSRTSSSFMPARLPQEWKAAATSTSKSTRQRTAMAEPVTLTSKLIRPKATTPFHYCQWDGTPVAATKHRTDHGDGRQRDISWSPTLKKEGLTTADLAPYQWHEFLSHHQQHGGPVLISKGELKVTWVQALGLQAISIHGWNKRLEAELLKLGSDVVLVPDCDLADLQGWYAKACKALPQARHLLTPGANWADPPKEGGVGLDDWLQFHFESVSPNTASDLLAAITDQPWGEQEEGERLPTYTELIAMALEAQKKEDTNRFMEVRAQLQGRFRAQDSLIRSGMLDLLREQQCGRTEKSPPPASGVNLRKVEPLEYQLDGFILKGDQSVIAGSTFAGKTMFMLALVDAHVRGQGFLDRAANECPPGKALFIAQDSGTSALLESFEKLGIDYVNDPIYQQDHPQQRVWVWGYEPDQGQMGWACDMAGLLRLKAFIQREGITFVVADSAKAITAEADVEYEINKEVKSLLTCTRDVICKPTGCHLGWITHPGHGSNPVAGAKAWREDPSMVCILTPVEDENGKRLGNKLWFMKNRADPPETEQRTVYYGLEEQRFVLQAGQQQEVQCSEAVLDCLWQFHQSDRAPAPVQQLIQLVFQRHGHSEKTVRNNLHNLTRGKSKSVLSPKRGFYSLAPAEQQRRAALAGSQQEMPLQDGAGSASPVDGETATSSASDHQKQGGENDSSLRGGWSKGQTNSKSQSYQEISNIPSEFSRDASGQIEPPVAGENPVCPDLAGENLLGILETPAPDSDLPFGCPVSHSPHVRARAVAADPVVEAIANPDTSDWQPVAFTSYRNDRIPDGLRSGDLVRSGPDGGIHRLASPTGNNAWQDTAGRIVPLKDGWQVLRPDQQEGEAAA